MYRWWFHFKCSTCLLFLWVLKSYICLINLIDVRVFILLLVRNHYCLYPVFFLPFFLISWQKLIIPLLSSLHQGQKMPVVNSDNYTLTNISREAGGEYKCSLADNEKMEASQSIAVSCKYSWHIQSVSILYHNKEVNHCWSTIRKPLTLVLAWPRAMAVPPKLSHALCTLMEVY